MGGLPHRHNTAEKACKVKTASHFCEGMTCGVFVASAMWLARAALQAGHGVCCKSVLLHDSRGRCAGGMQWYCLQASSCALTLSGF